MELVLLAVVMVTATSEVDGLLLVTAAAAAITACSNFLFLLTAAVAAAPLRCRFRLHVGHGGVLLPESHDAATAAMSGLAGRDERKLETLTSFFGN